MRLPVVWLARTHETAVGAAGAAVATIDRDVHAIASATRGRGALCAHGAASAAVLFVRARVHAGTAATSLPRRTRVATRAAVLARGLQVRAHAAATCAACSAWLRRAAFRTPIGCHHAGRARTAATCLLVAAPRAARAAVQRVFLEVEALIHLAVAVVVFGVAQLRRRHRDHALQALLAIYTGQNAFAASLCARRQHALVAAIAHVVHLAVAVVVAALIVASLGARLHAAFTSAELAVVTRALAVFATPDATRLLRPFVASRRALTTCALSRTRVFIRARA